EQLAYTAPAERVHDRAVVLAIARRLVRQPEHAVHQVHQRGAVVEHHVRRATWSQHAPHLGDRFFDVGRVVQHAERVHDIEARIGEVESLGVTQLEVDIDVAPGGELLGDL